MQILHTGRYAYNKNLVAPSPIQAPINPFTPRELTSYEIESQIDDFVSTAVNAKQAGYDGVEIMGSEGYFLINLSPNVLISVKTNGAESMPIVSACRLQLCVAFAQR